MSSLPVTGCIIPPSANSFIRSDRIVPDDVPTASRAALLCAADRNRATFREHRAIGSLLH